MLAMCTAQHKVYKFDFGRLSGEDEKEIYAVCDAVFDFIFLDTEYTPGDDEWNGMLAADKNVFKQGVLSESVKAAVKAAIAFRSLKTGRHDYGCGFDYDPGMSETECSGGRGQIDDSDNFNLKIFAVQHFENVTDGRDHGAAARAGADERPRLSALARQLIVLHAKFAPSMLRTVMQEVRNIFFPSDPPEPPLRKYNTPYSRVYILCSL